MWMEWAIVLFAMSPGIWAVFDGLFNGDDEQEDDDMPEEDMATETGTGDMLDDTTGTETGGTGTETATGSDLTGTSAGETLSGSAGADTMSGLAGDDTLDGGAGDDSLLGGADADSLTGGAGNDILYGSDDAGDDSTTDTLMGGDGDDTLIAGVDDLLTGGAGADTFDTNGDARITDFAATEDMLVINYSGTTAPTIDSQVVGTGGVIMTLSDGTVITLDGVTEAVPADAVSFVGDESGTTADPNVITGTEAADTPNATNGDDSVSGLAGNDTLNGQEGDDTLDGGADDDQLLGRFGDDLLIGGAGADDLRGADGNDVLYAGEEGTSDTDADTLDGGAGNDTLYGAVGDALTGGTEADVFHLQGGGTVTDFDASEDSLVIDYTGATAPTVTSQTVTAEGVVVALSDGAEITLSGLTEAVPASAISFEQQTA